MVKREDFMQLKVLLWKQFVVRKSKWYITCFEAFVPLVSYILLVIYRKDINAITISQQTPVYINNEPLRRVIYTPHTPMTRDLMLDIGKTLNLREINVEHVDHKSIGYWPAQKKYIIKFIKNMKNDEAILVFNNAEDIQNETLSKTFELRAGDELDPDVETPPSSESNLRASTNKIYDSYKEYILRNKKILHKIGYPDKLSYTIRMKQVFFTNIESEFEYNNVNHGKIYKNFLKLQWAVDSAYLKKKHGHPVLKNVTLRQLSTNDTCVDELKLKAKYFMTICNILSPIIPYMFIAMRLLDRRIGGVQELMKMVGVSSTKLAISSFIMNLPLAIFYAFVICIILRLFTNPVFAHTSRILLFTAQLLHYVSFIAFAFVISFIPKSRNFSTTIFVVSYAIALALFLVIAVQTLPRYMKVITGILIPFTAINWFYIEVTYKETRCRGLEIRDLTRRFLRMSSGTSLLTMLALIIFYFFLAWYLDKVRKRPYGISEPWNFLCTKSYWTQQEVQFTVEKPKKEIFNERFFEQKPQLEPGIQIVNLSKAYRNSKGDMISALTNLNLTIYKGEITVLVGENGAGKTTLMSIITGMTKATEGKVYIFGMDTTQNIKVVRKNLGLCPQENLSFPDLTIKEHILLFSMLKGMSRKEAEIAANDLLSKLKLVDKGHSKSGELTGGMKRRLQLAVALAGGANILILDEPTTGLDLDTRRELWDMLLRLRGQRTVLISTHYMEEADALGDRLAALQNGQLKSYATPRFLKKVIGTGYRLSLTIKKGSPVDKITAIIKESIPNSYLSDQTAINLTYRLPPKKTKEFGQMFDNLEKDRHELGIETIGIGLTTLDEVFLQLISIFNIANAGNGYTLSTYYFWLDIRQLPPDIKLE